MVSRLTLAILLVSASGALAAPLAAPPAASDPKTLGSAQPEAIFAAHLLRVCDQVERDYIREVDYRQLLVTGLTGLYQAARRPVPEGLAGDIARALEPRTALLLAKSQRKALNLGQEPGYGLETEDHRGGSFVTVRFVQPGSPADRAGVEPGDRITHLDGQAIRSMLDKQVFLRLNPLPGDCLALEAGALPALEVRVLRDQQLFELLCRAWREAGHAEGLGGRSALVVCCQAIAKSLDPHTTIVTAEERRKTLGLGQEGFGVGLETEEHRGGEFLVVKAVHPGSPAQQAGMRPGDRILQLDNRPVRKLTEEQVFVKLNPQAFGVETLVMGVQPPSAPLGVVFQRPGTETRTILTLTPQRYLVEHIQGTQRLDDQGWSYWVDGKEKLAHIRVGALGQGCSQQLREVLIRLEEEGMRGLILDLRWCPGGYMDQAIDVARLFLKGGEIARTQRRTGKERDHLYACQQPGLCIEVPLVLLVNGETQGGGELIAAALQDHKRAVVCGQRTVGKGNSQDAVALEVGRLGMLLTTSQLLRPSGKSLHRFPDSKDSDDWGVRPDPALELPVSVDFSKALRRWWLLHSLRPVGSRERLPLDDPSADPQRELALTALRELVQPGTAGMR